MTKYAPLAAQSARFVFFIRMLHPALLRYDFCVVAFHAMIASGVLCRASSKKNQLIEVLLGGRLLEAEDVSAVGVQVTEAERCCLEFVASSNTFFDWGGSLRKRGCDVVG